MPGTPDSHTRSPGPPADRSPTDREAAASRTTPTSAPASATASATASVPASVLERPGSRRAAWQPWVSLVLRLGIAVVAFAAALPKLTDLPAALRAVRAYEILPEAVVPLVGYGLPVVELLLGVLLLVGLFTRFSAVVFGLLMLVFIAGIASAWARGLAIDCGCFGGGGSIEPDQTAYPLEILRDLVFLGAAAVVARWPRTRLSLDHTLGLAA